MRRVHLRGHPNILKRLLVQVCGFNLGLLMRQLMGVGTPRGIVRLIRLDPKNLQSRTIRLQVDATRPGRRLGLV